MELLQLHNLIFILPLAAAVLLVFVMAMGIPMGDHDVHMGDFSHGGIGHADGLHAHGAQAGEIGHGWGIGAALSFLGIGKVPFAITLTTSAMVWGIAGLTVNQLGELGGPGHMVRAMVIAFIVALIGTGIISNTVAKLIPSLETYSSSAESMIGAPADVIHEVTAEGGMARLVDASGNLRDVNVVTEAGQPAIARTSRIVLTGYDRASDTFIASVSERAGGAGAETAGAGTGGAGTGGAGTGGERQEGRGGVAHQPT